jgi:hypothetical protein
MQSPKPAMPVAGIEKKFSDESKDLDVLRSTVVDAGGVGTALWSGNRTPVGLAVSIGGDFSRAKAMHSMTAMRK